MNRLNALVFLMAMVACGTNSSQDRRTAKFPASVATVSRESSTVPGNTVLGNSVPGNTLPGDSVPGNSVPGTTLPPMSQTGPAPGTPGTPAKPTTGNIDITRTSPNDPSSDDRTMAGLLLSLPTLNYSIDPRTFQISKPFTPGQGIINDIATAGRVFVPHYGLESNFPACDAPIPFNSNATLTPVIDGNLADWGQTGLVSIDRAGDGFAVGGVTYDLREFYFASDATHYYLGFKMANPWPANTGLVRLAIEFNAITIPKDNKSNVETVLKRTVSLFGNTLMEFKGNAFQNVVPAGNFAVAVKGNTIEMSFSKIDINASVGTPVFGVHPYIWSGDPAASKTDDMGPNILGLVDDYACLVAMPNQTVKMFPMRRLPTINPMTAEVSYRAIIAAAPTVESVLHDNHLLWDTIGMSVIDDALNPGIYQYPLGIFFNQIQYRDFGDSQMSIFDLAAHEYAHTINSGDYVLPRRWMKEGHSEWTRRMAFASYYGKYSEFIEFWNDYHKFADIEASHPAISIDTSSWTANSTYPEYYFYAKSSVFYELLSTLLPYGKIQADLKRPAQTASTYPDSAALLAVLISDPEFKASHGPTPWQGWFDGSNYSASVLPKQSLLNDADGDGLFAFQETRYGTSDTTTESLKKGMADPLSVVLGLPANTSPNTDHLILDQQLDDWMLLLPNELQAPQTLDLPAPDVTCQEYALVKRFGVVYDGDWIFIGIELGDAPGNRSGTVSANIVEPSGRSNLVQLDFGDPRIKGFGPDQTLVHTHHLLGGSTGKTVELAYHRTWLGWDKTFPSGTQIQVVSYMGSGNASVQCTTTQLRAPTFIGI